MSVPLPPISGGSVQPEYAATNITFNRGIQTVDGLVVPVFTASLSYQRTDYLLNAGGEKVGVVTTPGSGPGLNTNSDYFGNIYLSAEETAALFVTVPPIGESLGEAIANMADELIHADLVKRGIIVEN